MARKRKSDPVVPLRIFSNSDETANGEDIDGLIGVIHEQFKKKTKEQKQKTEQLINEAVSNAMQSVKVNMLRYEEQMYKKSSL
jgi:hypothetical protein